MSSARRAARGSLLAALVLVTAAAGAEEARRIGLRFMVSYVSEAPGPVDPQGEDLHRQLQREFRFRSLKVVKTQRVRLREDEIGSVQLPTGRWVRVRPLHLGDKKALLAVDVEGKMRTDVRVRSHQPVTIGVERYHDGKLVVTLEPDF